MIVNDNITLSSGIFWIFADDPNLTNYEFIIFNIPCDPDGTPNNTHSIELNSKKGNSYNHKLIWNNVVKNDNSYKPYNKKDFDYYPRGRVEISRNKATIFLNPNINKPEIIDRIKTEFGLTDHNICEVRIVVDGSEHYRCYLE